MRFFNIAVPLKIFALAVVVAFAATHASGQTVLSPESAALKLDSISSLHPDWERVELNGKLKMAGLPVSPSVKIFMVRDSLVRISMRAPFMGEVGRAEITDSLLTVANKMNKTYTEIPMDTLSSYYPGGLGDIQALLLGQPVIPGQGPLKKGMEGMVEFILQPDGSSTLTLAGDWQISGFSFGYVFDSSEMLSAIMAIPDKHPETQVTVVYFWYENGYDIEPAMMSPKKNFRAMFELDNPLWDSPGFEAFLPGKKFRLLSPEDFLKSF